MQDLIVAWRFLLKRPTSAAIAVVTLGITIGLSTIAVGAIDQAFWRSADAGRGADLVTIYHNRPAAPFYQTLSYPDYLDARDRLGDGLDLAALVRIENTLGGSGWPARVWGELVSGNYFQVLGARPFAGRLLTAADDRSADPVIVLGHALWQRQFGADPAVIGRSVRLGVLAVTVVGIAPAGFQGPAWPTDYWLPVSLARHVFGADILSRADAPIFQTVGRPRPGRTFAQIQGRATSFEPHAAKDGWRTGVYPAAYLRFWPAYRPAVARFLAIFAGLAVCILVIACANLAGLLLARAGERQRELALRQALGASRLQLARRLVAESAILTALGGGLGLFLAAWISTLVAAIPLPVPARLSVTFDLRLAITCLIVSLTGSVLFTTLSAWTGLRGHPRDILASSAGTLVPRSGAHRLLVVTQVALGCVMLTIGGLLARSAWQVERVDVGFRVEGGVIARIALYDHGYTNDAGAALYQQLQANLAQRPDVDDAALAWYAPVSPTRTTARVALAGSPDALQTRYNVVGPDYFRTLGVPVRAGREFEARDRLDGEPVAIVNEALASRLKGYAIGQTVRLPNESAPRRIVGIVQEIKYNGITEPSQPFVYLPLAQAFRQDMHVHIRTRAADAEALLRTELRRLDPNLALSGVRTLAGQLETARATPRASALASALAAAVAMALALVGIYGVLMTSVEQRRRELAIRAALGATPRAIVARVVREGLSLTLVGVVLGMGASVQAGGLVTSLLFGVEPRDPVVMTLVPLLVLSASVLGWVAPARRASQVDPVAALKQC